MWDEGVSRPACREDVRTPGEVKAKILQQVYLPTERRRSIWETNPTTWRTADKLLQKLPRWTIELSRVGSGMSTRWDVTMGRELSSLEVEAVKKSDDLSPLLGPADTSLEIWDAWLAAEKGPAPVQPAPRPRR